MQIEFKISRLYFLFYKWSPTPMTVMTPTKTNMFRTELPIKLWWSPPVCVQWSFTEWKQLLLATSHWLTGHLQSSTWQHDIMTTGKHEFFYLLFLYLRQDEIKSSNIPPHTKCAKLQTDCQNSSAHSLKPAWALVNCARMMFSLD